MIETGINNKKLFLITLHDIVFNSAIFRFLINVSVGGALVVIITYIHHSLSKYGSSIAFYGTLNIC